MKYHRAEVFFHSITAIEPQPICAAIVAAIETVTGRDEESIRILLRKFDHMAILIDSGDPAYGPKGLRLPFAHIPPALPGVDTLNDSAFFNRTVHHFRILGMNGDSFDMRNMRRGRIAPFISTRQFPHARKLHPSLATVIASEQERRLGARIDGHRIRRMKGQGKNFALRQSLELPRASAVGALIQTFFSACQKSLLSAGKRRNDDTIGETRGDAVLLQIDDKNSCPLHGNEKFPRAFHITS